MRSSINSRVVKSSNVEVSAPRMVECLAGFQQLSDCLAVLSLEKDNGDSARTENVDSDSELPDKEDIVCEADSEELQRADQEEVNAQAAEIISNAEAEAQKILAQAEADAQTILAQAQADAQKIINQAQDEVESLRQEVVKNAQAEIYPAAREEGYQAGRQAGEAEGLRLRENADHLFQIAQRAFQEEYAKVDNDLLHLAIKIAERIVRSTIALEPQRVAAIIQSLTLLPRERQGWLLHVAPDDARWLEENQPPCSWIIDNSLNPGDCFLECQEGVFDGRLEAQLDKLEHTLREELEHGGLESINSDSGSDRADLSPRKSLKDSRSDGGDDWAARQCG
ncbi:flagellar biosynthesis/type III secretory pathway protein [Desulfosporosinus orientis DSM 765]|uniref:Flagellar biosynthesis/type III secretory pathway protein n=1 Tax=Desulfosporosinus orientis (strain ATCC 19365 / DSM 765 / NCIMB 8382 / VKM B-1628 / Singapore I) TaxID=768706 RepID=G7WHZ2_DESOD|nr:FliH/SctL family protein [Desulfosporosinus orientis]AET70289.1 flagellar biosynthesis/type III secretory pathway protein [Desulfosporosinus orientis DSM 765]